MTEWKFVCPKCREIITETELRPGQNPLTTELLDLISLMPDTQTQEIVNYITELRATREMHKLNQDEARYQPDHETLHRQGKIRERDIKQNKDS